VPRGRLEQLLALLLAQAPCARGAAPARQRARTGQRPAARFSSSSPLPSSFRRARVYIHHFLILTEYLIQEARTCELGGRKELVAVAVKRVALDEVRARAARQERAAR